MKLRLLPVLLVLAALVLAGCDSPERTTASIQRDLASYSEKPDPATAARIEDGLNRLEAQIVKLRAAGRGTEADTWQQECDAMRLRFTAAKMAGSIQNMKQAAQNLGNAFRQAGEALGDALKDKDEHPPSR